MDLTTDLLDNAAFREAKRGYNTQDVDEFIEQVKAEYVGHEATLREARQRADAAEARVADAERRALEAAERANATSDADETLKRTLVLAQRTADAAIKEAEEQASRTLTSAQDQAARLLADAQEASARARAEAENEARRAQEEARTRVLAELRDLEAARDQLHTDVDNLERHLEEQRDRVRLTTRELQRLLDDPAALREVAMPVLADVVVPVADPVDVAPEAPEAIVEPEVEVEPDVAPAADEPAAWSPDDEAWQDGAEAATPPPSPAYADVPDAGPETEAVDMLAARDADDDAYLAELRKAMTDESPLGPREEDDGEFDTAEDAPRSRFGRRR
ncbi:MAG: DivIVA domain-containing protein [Acidimicrobiales bacterium]